LTVLAWLIGFLLPACGVEGAAGLPVPALMDMTKIERPTTPNTFLAGPASMRPTPDEVIGEQNLPASVLYEKIRVLLGAQPRTFVAAEYPVQLQIHYVVRSKLMNYPDLVTVQVDAGGADRSTLVIWSRSVYGRGDLGVNRDRTTSWLALLQQSNQR
jgi:hypothetical protein